MKALFITVMLALTAGTTFAACTDPAPPRVAWSGYDLSGANLTHGT
jgi:hypothetical protein